MQVEVLRWLFDNRFLWYKRPIYVHSAKVGIDHLNIACNREAIDARLLLHACWSDTLRIRLLLVRYLWMKYLFSFILYRALSFGELDGFPSSETRGDCDRWFSMADYWIIYWFTAINCIVEQYQHYSALKYYGCWTFHCVETPYLQSFQYDKTDTIYVGTWKLLLAMMNVTDTLASSQAEVRNAENFLLERSEKAYSYHCRKYHSAVIPSSRPKMH